MSSWYCMVNVREAHDWLMGYNFRMKLLPLILVHKTSLIYMNSIWGIQPCAIRSDAIAFKGRDIQTLMMSKNSDSKILSLFVPVMAGAGMNGTIKSYSDRFKHPGYF